MSSRGRTHLRQPVVTRRSVDSPPGSAGAAGGVDQHSQGVAVAARDLRAVSGLGAQRDDVIECLDADVEVGQARGGGLRNASRWSSIRRW